MEAPILPVCVQDTKYYQNKRPTPVEKNGDKCWNWFLNILIVLGCVVVLCGTVALVFGLIYGWNTTVTITNESSTIIETIQDPPIPLTNKELFPAAVQSTIELTPDTPRRKRLIQPVIEPTNDDWIQKILDNPPRHVIRIP